MREIKVQGKTIKEYPYLEKGSWVTGQVVYENDGKVYIVGKAVDIDGECLIFDEYESIYEVIPETVGQLMIDGVPIEEMTIQEIKDELTALREIAKRKDLNGDMKMYLKGYNDGQKAIAEVFAKTKENLCGVGEGGK